MLASKDRVSSNCADELRATISGDVALPGDQLYEKSCRIWNGAVRRHPAVVALCRRPEDVQARARRAAPRPATVGARRRPRLGRARPARRWARHRPGMGDVAVDPQALVATVAGGAWAKDVAAAAGAHNLVAAIGNCGSVGMAGLAWPTARSTELAASLRTTCLAPKSCWRTGGK